MAAIAIAASTAEPLDIRVPIDVGVVALSPSYSYYIVAFLKILRICLRNTVFSAL